VESDIAIATASGEDPALIAKELRVYEKDVLTFSKSTPSFLKRYANKWIGASQGEVLAEGTTLKSVIDALDKTGVPLRRVFLRYVEKEPRTLIL
jgi:hypothetical protein